MVGGSTPTTPSSHDATRRTDTNLLSAPRPVTPFPPPPQHPRRHEQTCAGLGNRRQPGLRVAGRIRARALDGPTIGRDAIRAIELPSSEVQPEARGGAL